MNTSIAKHARIWIYQADRLLTEGEVQEADQRLDEFIESWNAHGRSLTAHGEIRNKLFVILAVDEDLGKASGCSIDGSVHFMKALGAHLGVDFFARMTFAYESDNGIQLVQASEMKDLYLAGRLQNDTLFYDNLINTYGDLDEAWKKPLSSSWHYRFVS